MIYTKQTLKNIRDFTHSTFFGFYVYTYSPVNPISKGSAGISNHITGFHPMTLIQSRVLSSKNHRNKSSSLNVTSGKKKSKKLVKTPTAGYIGDTNFSLLVPMFASISDFITGIDIQQLVNKTVAAHDKIILNRGVISGSKRWREICLYVNLLIEGREPENPGWVSVGKRNKFPTVLSHLLPIYIFISDNISNNSKSKHVAIAIRFIRTLLKLNNVCVANKKLTDSLISLESKFKLDPTLVAKFEKFTRLKLQAIRESITLTDLRMDFFLGPSNGPNSRPKTETALVEASKLESETELHKAFKELCTITNNTYFFDFFSQCAKKYRKLPSHTKGINLRKLAVIPDKANKSRIIALCDFWTQCALQPIETIVIEVTEKLYSENIAFFSHREGWDKLMSQPSEVQAELKSIDASAWTDNLPASLQYIVIKALLGEKLADAWKALAVSCPWHAPGMPRPIKYGKGQGMGTKGSFVIAQLTDLIFVEFILNKDRPNNIEPPFFIKVGDDLVAQDPANKLTAAYETIGVPINIAKSKFSTSNGNFVEFVSRSSWNGIDCSIISPNLIAKYLRNDHYCLIIYNHMNERGMGTSITDIIGYKKQVQSSRKGTSFNEENFDTRTQTLLKLIKVVDQILDPEHKVLPLIDPFDNDDILIKTQELIMLARNLIYITLAELVMKTESVFNNQDLKLTSEKAQLLMGELRLYAESFNAVYGSTNHFFKHISSNEISFEESVILRSVIPILNATDNNISKGTIAISEKTLIAPFTFNDVRLVYEVNPEFINFIINTLGNLEDAFNSKITIKNKIQGNSIPNKQLLELFTKLRPAVDKSKLLLDFETNLYITNEGPKELNPDLITGYSTIFGFDRMLSTIDLIESSQTSTIEFPLSQIQNLASENTCIVAPSTTDEITPV